MKTRILTTRDAAEWDGYLARLPGADVYHTAAYHAAHEANGDGVALCWVAEHHDALFLYPYMVRVIGSTDLCDIETVYGYSGPLSNCRQDVWLAKCWECFGQTCQQSKVVAEFVRFNPLSENRLLYLGNHLDRYTVALDLSVPDLMASYSPTARNKIRKAERAGLLADEGQWQRDGEGFKRLYLSIMERNRAEGYYSFGGVYFFHLSVGLGERVRLFTVRDGGNMAVASLILTHGDRLHYHLTGSDAAYRDSGAGNLLIHAAALWGQAHGCRWLHLGGGRTNDPADSLLQFKASMGRVRLPFYVGKRIHNPEVYRKLCDDWKRRHPGQDGGGYFLLWRKA